MTAVVRYRDALRALPPGEPWGPYLLDHSGLPGPRGNLELAAAVAEEAGPPVLRRFAALDAGVAPTGTADEFLAFCGVLGLGRLAAEGDPDALDELRPHASDARWRVREAVAMALQRIGDADVGRLSAIAADWAEGTPFEMRAAVAGVAEPRLLRGDETAERALAILDRVTTRLGDVPASGRREEPFRVLRQALGYAWSVVIVARPLPGTALFERWAYLDDPDVRWVVRENLRKKRLEQLDPAWLDRMRATAGLG